MLTETNALGHVTTNTYDSNGRKLTETRTRTNGQGQPVALTRSFTYDDEGRTLSETDLAGRTRRMTYSPGGRLLTETDPLGNVTNHKYDASGRKIETVAGLNNTNNINVASVKETTNYDGEGGTIGMTDATGAPTSYALDLLGREIKETSSAADRQNHHLRRRRPSNECGRRPQPHRQLHLRRDRPQAHRDRSLGNITRFAYDPVGNLTTVTDALNRITRHDYDNLNRRIKTTYPDTTFQLFEYDELSRGK